MSAISGPNSELVKRLEKKLAAWPSNVPLADDRKRRFQLVGHIVRSVASLPKFVDCSNQALEKWLRDTHYQSDEQSLIDDFETFIQIAEQYAQVAFASSIAPKLAPVEFIYCVLLVHIFKPQLQIDQLAQAVQEMRITVRDEHVDIRMNTRVVKSYQQYLQSVLPKRIASDAFKPSGKRKRESGTNKLFAGDLTDEDAPLSPRKKKGDISTSARQSTSDLHLPKPRVGGQSARNVAAESSPQPGRSLFSPASTDTTMVSNTSRAEGMDIDETPKKLPNSTGGLLGGSLGGAIGGSLNSSSSNSKAPIRERSGWGRGLASFKRYPGQ
jgi:hypothetical protein